MSQFIRIERYTSEAFSSFDGTEVVITPQFVLFWRPPNPFGQWTRSPFNIVFRGNVAKFTQNRKLQDALLETGDRRLVEASPIDKIWGIGMAANDPMAYDPEHWRGLNLLGAVLEDVRAHISGLHNRAGE